MNKKMEKSSVTSKKKVRKMKSTRQRGNKATSRPL